MQVVILCGGRGTRLGAESEIQPKPMVQIGERPILWHIMKYYAHFGHADFVLCLGYKGPDIKQESSRFESLRFLYPQIAVQDENLFWTRVNRNRNMGEDGARRIRPRRLKVSTASCDERFSTA